MFECLLESETKQWSRCLFCIEERESERVSERVSESESESVCVCVCVCDEIE
jgi:predicted protein tyrosine phosphatase